MDRQQRRSRGHWPVLRKGSAAPLVRSAGSDESFLLRRGQAFSVSVFARIYSEVGIPCVLRYEPSLKQLRSSRYVSIRSEDRFAWGVSAIGLLAGTVPKDSLAIQGPKPGGMGPWNTYLATQSDSKTGWQKRKRRTLRPAVFPLLETMKLPLA